MTITKPKPIWKKGSSWPMETKSKKLISMKTGPVTTLKPHKKCLPANITVDTSHFHLGFIQEFLGSALGCWEPDRAKMAAKPPIFASLQNPPEQHLDRSCECVSFDLFYDILRMSLHFKVAISRLNPRSPCCIRSVF